MIIHVGLQSSSFWNSAKAWFSNELKANTAPICSQYQMVNGANRQLHKRLEISKRTILTKAEWPINTAFMKFCHNMAELISTLSGPIHKQYFGKAVDILFEKIIK